MKSELIGENRISIVLDEDQEVAVLRASIFEFTREQIMLKNPVRNETWAVLQGLYRKTAPLRVEVEGKSLPYYKAVVERFIERTPDRLLEIATHPRMEPTELLLRQTLGETAIHFVAQLDEILIDSTVAEFSNIIDEISPGDFV